MLTVLLIHRHRCHSADHSNQLNSMPQLTLLDIHTAAHRKKASKYGCKSNLHLITNLTTKSVQIKQHAVFKNLPYALSLTRSNMTKFFALN